VPDQQTWPPPNIGPSGRYQASDGRWYETALPPAPGYWLASDLRWYPPSAGVAEPWRHSRWGLGDAWWGALVYVVASLIVGIVVLIVAAASNGDITEDLELGPYGVSASVLANVVAFAGVPWLASRRKGLRSLAQDFGLRFEWRDLGVGIGIGIGSLFVAGIVGSALDQALGVDEATSNMPVETLTSVPAFVVMFLAVAVVTPVIEELFFRGLIYRSLLKRGMRTWGAIAVNVVVFVLPHLLAVPQWPNVVTLFTTIGVLGLAFTLACHWSGNRLGPAIVAHALINGTALIVLFAQSQ
jgi:membrane protease YdiL (CAAX protease family)